VSTNSCAGTVSDVVDTFLSPDIVLTANGKFLVVPLLHSVSDMITKKS